MKDKIIKALSEPGLVSIVEQNNVRITLIKGRTIKCDPIDDSLPEPYPETGQPISNDLGDWLM